MQQAPLRWGLDELEFEAHARVAQHSNSAAGAELSSSPTHNHPELAGEELDALVQVLDSQSDVVHIGTGHGTIPCILEKKRSPILPGFKSPFGSVARLSATTRS